MENKFKPGDVIVAVNCGGPTGRYVIECDIYVHSDATHHLNMD
jgi:hypothetical protein